MVGEVFENECDLVCIFASILHTVIHCVLFERWSIFQHTYVDAVQIKFRFVDLQHSESTIMNTLTLNQCLSIFKGEK